MAADRRNWLCIPHVAMNTPAARGPATRPSDSNENANPMVVPWPSLVLSDKKAFTVGLSKAEPTVEIDMNMNKNAGAGA